MPVPLALVAPAALAGAAYLDARLGISYDYRLIGAALKAQIRMGMKEKKARLNQFYILEDHALNKKTADDICLIFERRQWTYKEVYQIVLKQGTWLKKNHGIKPQDIVVMDFMNSEKFIFMWLGIWSIGAKPAFINYNLTGKPLAHCIRISTSKIAFLDPEIQSKVTQEVRDELPGVQFEVFTPQLEAEVASTEPVRAPDADRAESKRQGLALVIYTSGTTGLPKGAIVSYSKVIVGADVACSWMRFTQKDVFYTSMPLYHSSASVLGFCSALRSGAAFSLGKKFSTKTFWQEVRDTKATYIQYVGETCRYLLSAPPQFDPVTGENLDKKHQVKVAFGNGLRPDIWNRFKERFGIAGIAEFYSATESSSAAWNFSRNDFSRGAIGRGGSISKLLFGGNVQIVKVDLETEKPFRDPNTGFCEKVTLGEPGEMLYKLDANDIGLKFQGYWNNKDSTESKIIRDVFVKGDAYFRTGDMMSADDKGCQYFNDRIGDTYRWKGENVSTSEVSQSFGTHSSVHEANVYGIELPHHDGRVGCVALVLAEEPSDRLMQDLARHVHAELPRFAVPLFLRLTKQMDLTGTNKHQKHIARTQGVNPEKISGDELYWLKGGSYVKFSKRDWEELNGGRVRL